MCAGGMGSSGMQRGFPQQYGNRPGMGGNSMGYGDVGHQGGGYGGYMGSQAWMDPGVGKRMDITGMDPNTGKRLDLAPGQEIPGGIGGITRDQPQMSTPFTQQAEQPTAGFGGIPDPISTPSVGASARGARNPMSNPLIDPFPGVQGNPFNQQPQMSQPFGAKGPMPQRPMPQGHRPFDMFSAQPQRHQAVPWAPWNNQYGQYNNPNASGRSGNYAGDQGMGYYINGNIAQQGTGDAMWDQFMQRGRTQGWRGF